jgi:hypothetical protein
MYTRLRRTTKMTTAAVAVVVATTTGMAKPAPAGAAAQPNTAGPVAGHNPWRATSTLPARSSYDIGQPTGVFVVSHANLPVSHYLFNACGLLPLGEVEQVFAFSQMTTEDLAEDTLCQYQALLGTTSQGPSEASLWVGLDSSSGLADEMGTSGRFQEQKVSGHAAYCRTGYLAQGEFAGDFAVLETQLGSFERTTVRSSERIVVWLYLYVRTLNFPRRTASCGMGLPLVKFALGRVM